MSVLMITQATIHDLDALAPLFDDYRMFYGQPSDLTGARHFSPNVSDSWSPSYCSPALPETRALRASRSCTPLFRPSR
ncbi:hypothetical protein COHCIP112018_00648 [Cohnella sp. JJ-181]|nr:hypothetical protein COHCIP112018_00648 [Cohnella sp. JJ-181]